MKKWRAVSLGPILRGSWDTVSFFDSTGEDLSGLAEHLELVGNVYNTLDKEVWSLYWDIDHIGSTDNQEYFGFDIANRSEGNPVGVDLKADSVMYHSLTGSYTFDNGRPARVGVANLLNERPPRMTAPGTGNEVSILGEIAFYSQYAWSARFLGRIIRKLADGKEREFDSGT